MATKRETDEEQRIESPGPEADGDEAPAGGDTGPAGDVQAAGSTPAVDERAAELAEELESARNRHLRLAADFENFKKRARQEHLETVQYAAATVAERLLPVLDDVERALDHAPEGADEGWVKGVRMTFHKLEEVLASVGVERIEAVGAPFSPRHHEAIGFEESTEHPDDTVLVELRPGYKMHDRVLRPSLVKVSRRQG
jgi:molecular chaperone GrpE